MQSESHKNASYSSFFKRLATWTGVFAIAFILIFTFSKTAHAGLLSLMASVFGGEQASAKTRLGTAGITNYSQVGSVLQAHSGPNPTSDTLAIAPVDSNGETLVPDMAVSDQGGADTNTQITTYTVQSDDTLSGIADIFGISVDTIKRVNNISGNTIRPGQTLTILPVDGSLYTVQSGDSVGSIAKKLGASQEDILTYNSLTSSSLIVKGDQLIIPHGTVAASQAKTYVATIALKAKVPSFEPLLDPVWEWPAAPAGYYSCPLLGSVLTQGLHGHNAVDLAAPRGTPIRAAASGIVTQSKSNGLYNGGYGNFVMISHTNGSQTLYGHMSKTTVSSGDKVSQGEIIGYVGMTGLTTGPHVHFEIRGAQNPFANIACR
jgi:murein DD-endopeptidase MepM/ murein hydrolase activator NlpD